MRQRLSTIAAFISIFLLCARGDDSDPQPEAEATFAVPSLGSDRDGSALQPILPAILPIISPPAPRVAQSVKQGIDWTGLFTQSLNFLALEHGFRYLTEYGTRHPGTGTAKGYLESVGNLHGWSDGDPALVNYVGHPMQGSLAGYIWLQNDRKFRNVEFGNNRAYWKSRLRATAFSWVYSTQFEIGPVSEASLGNVQRYIPQQGFVDHIVTPTIGLAWMVAEDAIDKHVISWVERKTKNPWIRLAARGGLNPTRSMANVFRGEVPWLRDTRTDLFTPGPAKRATDPRDLERADPYPTVPSMDVIAVAQAESLNGRRCAGGGASASVALSAQWRLVGDVRGCEISGYPTDASADSLTYMAGLRWTPLASSRWSPYAELMFGGKKVTTETIDRVMEAQLVAENQGRQVDYKNYGLYRHQESVHGPAISAGTGLDWRLNSAVGVRLASLAYGHAWIGQPDGLDPRRTLQLSTGVILRLGTW